MKDSQAAALLASNLLQFRVAVFVVANLEHFMMLLRKHALPNKFVQQASILIRQIKHVFLVEKTAQVAKFTLVNALTKKIEF